MTKIRPATRITVSVVAGLAALSFALPASAQIVGGSGGLVGEGQVGLPGAGVAGQGSIGGSVGVDAGELRNRTGATVRGTADATKRTANRTKNKIDKAKPSVSAGASGSAAASSEGVAAEGSADVSVNRPD